MINAIGRRKTSVARIYMQQGSGKITVNDREFKDYFPTLPLQYKVMQPFTITNNTANFDVKVNLKGGGVTGQAEAVRLAVARALIKQDPELRGALKSEGMLKRDPRMVERKKPGQPKARKKFQFSKR